MSVALQSTPSLELVVSLRRLGVIGDCLPPMTPLCGGVSSEVWRLDLDDGPVCVKRALPRLRVEAVWDAPVERTQFEAAWLEVAGQIVPGIGPRVVAHDPGGALVLAYLDHPVWKDQLRDGVVDPAVAAEVARSLATVHAVTARRTDLAARFDNEAVFAVMRLDPYFGASAAVHPDLAATLYGIQHSLLNNRRALIHGDANPKNILVGPNGPIFLDSECATWGDPAFGLALCAAHLLLKCRWNDDAVALLLACFDAFTGAYVALVDWEDPAALEARAAALTAACLLARVDGRSPVEYLDHDGRHQTRRAARRLLRDGAPDLLTVRQAWGDDLHRS
jgi:aminoglycoside phosphotransferase (APT) family kinase protein